MGSGKRIGRALGRLFKATRTAEARPDVRPACEFGVLVEERLKDLGEDLREVRNLLRAVLLALVGALIGLAIDIIMRGVS